MTSGTTLNGDTSKSNSGSFSSLKVIIIGGTGGIGRALSRFLASKGAKVIVVGQTYRDEDISEIEFVKADLSLMGEAHRVAQELPIKTSDILIFTTGIVASAWKEETADGLERDMAVSYLNRLVMLRSIAPYIGSERKNPKFKPRVYLFGYPGTNLLGNLDDLNSEKSYKFYSAHMNTVAGNEALVLESSRRYPSVNFFGINPGIIKTNIRSNLMGGESLKFRLTEWFIGFFCQTVDDFAKHITPILTSPDFEESSGTMFNKNGKVIPPSPGLTNDYVSKYIAKSEELVQKWIT